MAYPGYPPAGGAPGYPPYSGGGPPQPGFGGMPQPGPYQDPQAGGYPQPGYSPAQPGYPPQQQGYPQQGGYPQAQPGYPPAGGYPSVQPGYPPAQPGAYPGATPGYGAPQGAGYPPQSGAGYPQQGYGAAPGGYAAAPQRMMTCGTIRQVPNNPEEDCKTIHKAVHGLGTDEDALIQVFSSRTNAQRQQLRVLYKQMFGQDLIERIRKELSSNFEHAMVALLLTPAEFDAKECRHAMAGAGTDEHSLVEILSTRTNAEIAQIKMAYKMQFNRDLEHDISSETSGNFKRLLVALACGARKEGQPVDMAKAQMDAQALYSAGAGRVGTEESTFVRLLAAESHEQLAAMFDVYQRQFNRTIEQTLESELSGDFLDGMLAIVECVRYRPGYFARRVHHAVAGAGTKDYNLVRVLVSRSEIDLMQVKEAYQRKYGETLLAAIRGDTSGDYGKLLHAIIGN